MMRPPRLIFLTGKGGTGKSALAAALGLALARRRPTLIADLDQRCSAARLLGAEIAPGESASVSDELQVVSLAQRTELEAFIERIVPLKMVSRRMLQSRTVGYVSAALPGLEAFLILERLRILAGDAALHDRFVVADGPATGSALELLSVAEGVQQIAPLGTLNRLGSNVENFLADPGRFGLILTVLPEELAVREAIEAAAAVRKLGITRVAAILNGVSDALFDEPDLAALKKLGAHGKLALRRIDMARQSDLARADLVRAGLQVFDTPMLFCPSFDTGALLRLSGRLDALLKNWAEGEKRDDAAVRSR